MKSGFQKVIASLLIAIIMISTTSITVDSAATVGDIKDDYVRSGLDIVKQAASHLGRAYNGSFGSETDEKGYNCTGIIYRALEDLGYSFSPVHNCDNSYPNIPRHTNDWHGGYTDDVTNNTDVTCNNITKKVNVLFNSESVDEYQNAMSKFPMGAIVIATGTATTDGHAWIFLGELGNRDQAIEKLKSYGIITNEQEQYVIDTGSGSNYWVLDSSVAGSGVKIRNYIGGSAGGSKHDYSGYWVYQIANQPTFSGSYHVNLGKKDRDNPDGDYIAGVTYTVDQSINGEKKQSKVEYVTENKLKNISGEVNITDTTKYDNYIFGEKNAEDVGYATVGGTYGVNVYKTIVNQKYTIEKIVYYSGSEDNLKKQEIKPGEKYWILSSRDAKIDKDVTDEQKKNSIAYIELASKNADGTVGAFTYVGLNKSINGTYHMNIAKKSTNDDSELSDKSKALGGTTFTVSKKVYGQTEEKKEVTTEEGKASSSIFGNVDIDKDGIGANKPDEYRIEETNTTEGYENIDLSNIVIYVYKKALQEKYVIDYVRIDKDGKEIGHANSGEGKNAEQKFDINDDGVYDIGLEVSDDGVAFGITIRNTQKEGKYNVKLIKTDLLGNPLTEKETVFSINGEDQTTVDGEVEIATEKEITEDGQKDEYKIKETSAPEGYELYTGEIALTAVGKEFEKSLALDEEATKLTVNNEELPQGETSKDGYVTWSLDGDTITIKVKNSYFDLALRKWVTQAIVTENGQTVVTETGHKAEDDPEDVVKVDLRKSKLNDVTVKFKYSIRITNEGEIAGEATEIRDDIPKGLKFVAEDNPDWREENGQIVTDKLAGTTLKSGESAEVEIILTWINSEDNLGVLINTAEINKDHNEYGVPDRDSTPGNNVPGEDDIDDAPVMVTIKTGSEIALYIAIVLGTTMILVSGIVMIKKKVLINWE